ncbi:ribosomal protein subunit S18 [Schizosaccharomyces japonicus yFS275]|uniref:Small ribosomal subunit protein bS18m n=1 Tax=Schizosaccharomyces japonicus (strain yFS275 / FY16936) TaxID=402676 RepID=B6K6E9_SCHJY|nr:ribosomal protein subunit S18 [Schizosaccharomyces japonicus yFS275]EEB09103.2 ribosomal protein subunit S18 [Schizosaccharomyces japonicus yFS275]
MKLLDSLITTFQHGTFTSTGSIVRTNVLRKSNNLRSLRFITTKYNTSQQRQGKNSSSVTIPRSLMPNLGPGDVYTPSDLTLEAVDAQRNEFRQRRPADPFTALGKSPLDYWKNPVVLSEYLTELGRIKHRAVTGLSAKHQRQLTRAIKRARATGVLPSKCRSVHWALQTKF